MKRKLVASLLALACFEAFAMEKTESLYGALMVDEFETSRESGDDATAWDIAAMVGNELNKLWILSEGERVEDSMESHELRAYASRAVSPRWNLVAGWRGDIHPDPERNWFMVGLEGVAPFFVETKVLLFAGSENRSGLRVSLEKEMMLTQRWQLVPEVEFEVHGHNDEETGTGSGLSSFEASLRLGYEVTPRFLPYVGVSWGKGFGQTADYLREEGEDTESSMIMFGVRFWL
ncbi:MAG: copper resistance protein B [Porticoccaceae bacterium]|jgi:copper resistance protein B|nr:copper resistance protein B [Porticoccaceae bacterium]HLS97529.1 copper resistance protein B [Porticoccaceae bacterium]